MLQRPLMTPTQRFATVLSGILMLVALVASTAIAQNPPPFGADECSGCSRLGFLSVQLSSIEPPQPVVGDLVTLTFAVDYQLPGGVDCSFGTCSLEGGEALFEGDDPPSFTAQGLVVQRRAVGAGTATVELHVHAMTEEQCLYVDPEQGCLSYFQFVDIEASSGPVEIQILEPTPTATPTATPTPTGRASEDDGCAIGRPARPSRIAAIGILTLPLLLLRLARRTRQPPRT